MANDVSKGKRQELERRRARNRMRLIVTMLTAGSLLGGVLSYAIVTAPDGTPSAVLAATPEPGSYLRAGTTTFSLTFSRPLGAEPLVILSGTESLLVESTGFDGPTWVGSVEIPEGADGSYVLEVAANGGGPAIEPAHLPYVVDTFPPESLAVVSSAQATGSFDVSWEATDDGSGISRVELWMQLNGGGWTQVATSVDPSGTHTVEPGVQDARIGIYTVATDAAGNREEPPEQADVVVTFVLARATLVAPGAYWLSGNTTLVATAGPGVVSASLFSYFSTDNATWDGPTFVGNATGTLTWAFSFPRGPGHYRLFATAYDAAGRSEPPATPASAEAAMGYDPTPPSSELAALAGYWTDKPIAVTSNAADGVSGLRTVELWSAFRPRAAANWSAWSFVESRSGPGAFTFAFPDGEGHYLLQSRAVDRAGNVEDLGPGDVAVGYNRDAPPAAVMTTVRDLMVLLPLTTWTIAPPQDLNRFELHRGMTPNFGLDAAPCGQSGTCIRELSIDARISSVSLPARDVIYYFVVRAVDEEGKASVSNVIGAIKRSAGYDTPDTAGGSVDLAQGVSWVETLTDDEMCLDGADWFRVTMDFPRSLGAMAVPSTSPIALDLVLTVFDSNLQVIARSDLGRTGASESVSVMVGGGTYYVVVSALCTSPIVLTGWYTLSIE